MNLISRLKNIFQAFIWKKHTTKSTAVKTVAERAMSDEEYNTRRKIKQDKIDIILDKISMSGYDSLSQGEKDLLDNLNK
jgi:hypothetical protein